MKIPAVFIRLFADCQDIFLPFNFCQQQEILFRMSISHKNYTLLCAWARKSRESRRRCGTASSLFLFIPKTVFWFIYIQAACRRHAGLGLNFYTSCRVTTTDADLHVGSVPQSRTVISLGSAPLQCTGNICEEYKKLASTSGCKIIV